MIKFNYESIGRRLRGAQLHRFRNKKSVEETMPLLIVRQDITKMRVDAIVNATCNALVADGGVDSVIRKIGGAKLAEECALLGGCNTGDAKITKAYNLPCKFIIHTVGPVWSGGKSGEDVLLASCYSKSLALARDNGAESVAFPLISTGSYGYPKEQALVTATATIGNFLQSADMTVYLVVFDKESFSASEKMFGEVREYIDNNYVDEAVCYTRRRILRGADNAVCLADMSPSPNDALSIGDRIKNLDESFSQRLLRLIDEKGITDVECYKRANVDRKVFSKIRTANAYRPSKTTAVAFAIALELPLDEAKELVELAGYSMTHNNVFDVIIEYFIVNRKYDVLAINEALFEFDQKLLGC